MTRETKKIAGNNRLPAAICSPEAVCFISVCLVFFLYALTVSVCLLCLCNCFRESGKSNNLLNVSIEQCFLIDVVFEWASNSTYFDVVYQKIPHSRFYVPNKLFEVSL